MPRMGRIKNEDFKLHVMVRSIKELDLFKENEDKVKYLSILRKFQLKHGFKVYAYCLMSNHGHLIIDCAGADISKSMHAINLSYARYYNHKYNRYGHLFQDRFKSKVINTHRYLINLSAYIHNNPKDIPQYKDNIELYPFSSFKEYLNKTDTFGILSKSLLSQIVGFDCKEKEAAYITLVRESNDAETLDETEFTNDQTEYINHKDIITKYKSPQEVINHVARTLTQNPLDIYVKYRRSCAKIRALSCVFMVTFCNMNQKEICETIGNISPSGISYLTSKGLGILLENRKLIDNFIAP
ncbi:MAG TPA: transposase [Epulopiscium sp.]|nr:transposase [Candidatus Epulonipiscium sp.]